MHLTLEDFEGSWVLERRIMHEDGTDAQFRGSARFHPQQDTLIYEEKGLLKVEGHRPVSAQRGYIWRKGAGGKIEVLFDDGRPFHFIEMKDPRDTHYCDPDTYELAYRFGGFPDWISTCRVSGPKKAYQMVSTYRRPVEGID